MPNSTPGSREKQITPEADQPSAEQQFVVVVVLVVVVLVVGGQSELEVSENRSRNCWSPRRVVCRLGGLVFDALIFSKEIDWSRPTSREGNNSRPSPGAKETEPNLVGTSSTTWTL